MPTKRDQIKNYNVGDVVFIHEKINDTEERETYYMIRDGVASRQNYIAVARLATFQGEVGKYARYMVINNPPCTDPGEIHGANPVYPMDEGIFKEYVMS